MSQQPRDAIVHQRFTEYAAPEAVVKALARYWQNSQLHDPMARLCIMPADIRARLSSTQLSRSLLQFAYAHLLPP